MKRKHQKMSFAERLVNKVFHSYGERLVNQFENSLRQLLGKTGEYYYRNERAIMDIMSIKANCSAEMYDKLVTVENKIFNGINRDIWDS